MNKKPTKNKKQKAKKIKMMQPQKNKKLNQIKIYTQLFFESKNITISNEKRS
jgi:hypothetical protein